MGRRKGTNQRDAAKEKFWRQAIARQTASGLKQAEFCERERLNINTFQSWKRTLLLRDEEAKLRQKSADKRAKNELSFWHDDGLDLIDDATFVPVVVTETKTDTKQISTPVAEIRFAKATIAIFAGADRSTLRALLSAFDVCPFEELPI